MAVLADLERLLERVFERSTARLFRAHPQAVQLERRVERAMERARVSGGGRVAVPARYRVRLHPEDLAEVADATGGPEALAGRLADAALRFARSHGYQLPGRPTVALVADPSVERGVIEVDARSMDARGSAASAVVDGVAPMPVPVPVPPAAARLPVPDVPVLPPRRAAEPPAAEPDASQPAGAAAPDLPRAAGPELGAAVGRARPVDAQPAPTADHDASAGPASAPDPASAPGGAAPGGAAPGSAPAPSSTGGIRGDGTRTLVFRKPAPAPTRAVLRVIARDGAERTIEVDGTPLAIGRAGDNGLVLSDPRVSRHHARLQARRGTLVFTDLTSTNGSRLNGVRVDECALGMGDRLLLGDTVLLVEQLPG